MMVAGRQPAASALWIWRAMIVLGWAMILAGLAMSVWDCLMWLRDGYWSRLSLADLWGRVPLGGDGDPPGWEDMRGLHRLLYGLLHWFGRFPVSLALMVAGLVVAWTGNGRHERVERSLALRRRRQGAGGTR